MLLGSRKNVLLVKDDVGMAKPTTKDLPGDDFAFGRDKRYVESAQQGTSSMANYSETCAISLSLHPPRYNCNLPENDFDDSY